MAGKPDNVGRYFVGVDGGGTRCRALLVDENNTILGVGNGGPANPYQDVNRALSSVLGAIDVAIDHAKLGRSVYPQLVVGLGLAGVNVASVYKTVALWDFPFFKTYLTTDLHIACIAAHESIDGAVMIAGTGSCGFCSVKGRSLTIGGHGFPAGDKGSGAWLGLAAVQAILLADDKLGPATLLSGIISEHLQCNVLQVIERLEGAKQSDFARLAPCVFLAAERGDQVACQILADGAAYLAEMAKKLLACNPHRISMIGGIAERMLGIMEPSVAKRFEPALQPPEFGAVMFARHQFEADKSR